MPGGQARPARPAPRKSGSSTGALALAGALPAAPGALPKLPPRRTSDAPPLVALSSTAAPMASAPPSQEPAVDPRAPMNVPPPVVKSPAMVPPPTEEPPPKNAETSKKAKKAKKEKKKATAKKRAAAAGGGDDEEKKDELGQDTKLLLQCLASPNGMELFTRHCEKEFSSENIEFLAAVFEYQEDVEVYYGVQEYMPRAERIVHQFIDNNAPKQVNIDGASQQEILETINDPELPKSPTGVETMQCLFDDALSQVLVMISRDSFKRFKLTDDFKRAMGFFVRTTRMRVLDQVDDRDVLFEGWLEKKSPSLIGQWQKRWVMILDGPLCYYSKTRPKAEEFDVQAMSGELEIEHLVAALEDPRDEETFNVYLRLEGTDDNDATKRVYIFRTIEPPADATDDDLEDFACAADWLDVFESFAKDEVWAGGGVGRPANSSSSSSSSSKPNSRRQSAVLRHGDFMPGFCEVEGWLYKKSPSVMKGWQKRWFVLFQNGRLYYWKKKSKTDEINFKTAAGWIDVSHILAVEESEKDDTRFQVVAAVDEDDPNRKKNETERAYWLQAVDGADRLLWCANLRRHTGQQPL